MRGETGEIVGRKYLLHNLRGAARDADTRRINVLPLPPTPALLDRRAADRIESRFKYLILILMGREH